MMSFLTYDLKVGVLIAVFYMFYRLMLSRETFHRVNRLVLLSTAVASFVLPLCVITMHETVVLDADGSGLNGLDGLWPVEGVAAGDAVKTPATPWWQVALPILYIIGVVATLAHTVVSVTKVWLLICSSERHQQQDGVTICVVDRPALSPFSWMKYIVMNRQDYAESDAAILAHERGHIRLHHSWDVLLVDLLTALQWPNPAMWMLRQDLRAIHEYEADGAVLSQGVNARQYQYLLITKAASIGGYSIANGISHSTLKNRITMMTKHNSRRSSLLKLLAIVPIVGAALALNARTVKDYVYNEPQKQQIVKKGRTNQTVKLGNQELKVTESGDVMPFTFRVVFWPENAPIEGVPVEVVDDNGKVVMNLETGDDGKVSFTSATGRTARFKLIDKVKEVKLTKALAEKKQVTTVAFGEGSENFEEKTFTARGTVCGFDDGKPTPIVGAVVRVVGSTNTKGTVTDREGKFSLDVQTGDALLFSYVGYESEQIGASQIYSLQDDFVVVLNKTNPEKIYDVVQQMPQFPGGVGAMMQYLAQNVRYPAEAEQTCVQGRVIVTFVVERDGSIASPRVMKSVDPLLDAEALRVVQAMPNWEPGRQDGEPMRVKYTVPITFRLHGAAPLPASADDKAANQSPEVVAVGYPIERSESFVVIDGKPATTEQFKALNPDDIDHIDVLKGESATKKYGDKAKHGAIVITTNKAKK